MTGGADILALIESHHMNIVYRKVHADWAVWTAHADAISPSLRLAVLECAKQAPQATK